MKHKYSYPLIVLSTLFIFSFLSHALAGELPKGFVYVDDNIPGIEIEMRYYTDDNFIGKRIDGYMKPRCIATREAAEALKGVQNDLSRFSLGLKLFDAYRPQRAVDHFVRWAKDLHDTKMKPQYYPDVAKKDLFKEDYIAKKSSHTRGSTFDLTIISLDLKEEIDMGSGFDFFSTKSWPDNPSMTPAQRSHRMLLQVLMIKHGFKPYPKEWWHFTLVKEPFPETYFDFPVQ